MPWFNFSQNDFALAFLSLLFEGIPFLLLGALISGLVDVFVSSDLMDRILPRNRTASVFLTGLLGLVFPMCECGSVIVIRRFIRKGLPLSCAVTYMLGAPIVSPIVALSTYAAFTGRNPLMVTSLRLSIGYAIAVIVGLIVARLDPSKILQPGVVGESGGKRASFRVATAPALSTEPQRDFADIATKASFPRKLLLSTQSATADFLDVTFFFIIGCAITSLFNTAVNQQLIQNFATMPLLSIVTLMGLAAALALCSTTDAFVAASFAAFSLPAKLAFMLFGPVFDVKLFWLYGLIFKRRFVVLLSISLFVVIAFLCWQLSNVL